MLNNVNVIGYLGGDAQSRTTRNGANFVVLSLATKRSWKDRQSGEWNSQTTWLRCLVFGRAAEFAATLTKGAQLQITGAIQTRKYVAQDGSNRSVTEIRVERLTQLNRSPKPSGAAA